MVKIRDAVDEWSLKATNDILTTLADKIEDDDCDVEGATAKPPSKSNAVEAQKDAFQATSGQNTGMLRKKEFVARRNHD